MPRVAPPEPPPGLTEDELDLWEPKPPVDAPYAGDWRNSNAAHFDFATCSVPSQATFHPISKAVFVAGPACSGPLGSGE